MRKSLTLLSLLTLLLMLGVVATLMAGSSTVGAALSDSIGEPQWGPDIRVDPTTTALLEAQRNSSIAINPTDPNIALSSFDHNVEGVLTSGYGRSSDAGRTWSSDSFQGPWGADKLSPLGDTNVEFDSRGVAYYSSLAIGDNSHGYFVLTTTNGIAWSTPQPVIVTGYEQSRLLSDLAVDPRSSGPNANSLYLFWYRSNNVPPIYQGIQGRYSRDGGRTWSSDLQVSDPGNEATFRPSAVVAHNGTIYVAFAQVDDFFIGNPPELYLDRSTDGGVSWGPDRLISGARITPIGRPDFKKRELTLIGSAGQECVLIRIHHNPSIGVSPIDSNTVYAVWNDGRWETTIQECLGSTEKHSDIAFSRSTDGGSSWSMPVRINDDSIANGVDQFQPDLRVAPDGTIAVIWYDRRYAANPFYYDLAYTQSTDGGITWSPNRRVSDVSSNPNELPDYKSIDDLGDHKGMAIGPDYLLPGWIDSRRGNFQGDFYVDRGVFPVTSPTITATASSTATRTSTGVPTATASFTRTPGAFTSTSTPPPATHTPGAPTATPTVCIISFTDVPPGSTFHPYVRCLACRGILGGYPDGTFRPNANITRGQLSKIVANSAGFNEPVDTWSFEDVPVNSTFWEFVERMASRGIIGGYGCGSPGEPCVPPENRPYFRPGANATRGQISKIVSEARQITDPPGPQLFEDVPPGSTFYDWIQRLANRGVMGGYTCGSVGEPCVPPENRPYFRPGNNATRGQTSKIVANTFFPECQPKP